MIPSIQSSALAGMARAEESALKHAEELQASFSPSPREDQPEASDAVVGLALDSRQHRASSRLLGVARSMTKAVLDILA